MSRRKIYCIFSSNFQAVTQSFTDEAGYDVLDYFADNEELFQAQGQAVHQAIEHVKFSMEWRNHDIEEIQRFIDQHFSWQITVINNAAAIDLLSGWSSPAQNDPGKTAISDPKIWCLQAGNSKFKNGKSIYGHWLIWDKSQKMQNFILSEMNTQIFFKYSFNGCKKVK